MKLLRSIVISLLLVGLLSACGGDAETDTTTTDANTNDNSSESFFTVNVSGDVETNYSDDTPRSFCSEDYSPTNENARPWIELIATSEDLVQRVEIRVPLGLEPGTYELMGLDGTGTEFGEWNYDLYPPADGGKISFQDANRDNWQFGTGEITIEALASNDGDTNRGSYSAELVSDDDELDGQTVLVSGEFDYTAGFSSFTEESDVYTDAPCD